MIFDDTKNNQNWIVRNENKELPERIYGGGRLKFHTGKFKSTLNDTSIMFSESDAKLYKELNGCDTCPISFALFFRTIVGFIPLWVSFLIVLIPSYRLNVVVKYSAKKFGFIS